MPGRLVCVLAADHVRGPRPYDWKIVFYSNTLQVLRPTGAVPGSLRTRRGRLRGGVPPPHTRITRTLISQTDGVFLFGYQQLLIAKTHTTRPSSSSWVRDNIILLRWTQKQKSTVYYAYVRTNNCCNTTVVIIYDFFFSFLPVVVWFSFLYAPSSNRLAGRLACYPLSLYTYIYIYINLHFTYCILQLSSGPVACIGHLWRPGGAVVKKIKKNSV